MAKSQSQSRGGGINFEEELILDKIKINSVQDRQIHTQNIRTNGTSRNSVLQGDGIVVASESNGTQAQFFVNNHYQNNGGGESVSPDNSVLVVPDSDGTKIVLDRIGFSDGEMLPFETEAAMYVINGKSEFGPRYKESDFSNVEEKKHKFCPTSFCSCTCGLNGNVRTLWLLLLVNTSFTIAQLVGAVKADSLAMYGDCSTMALDSLTYMLNIYAEKRKKVGTIEAARLEVYVASFSIVTLVAVTAVLLWDAIRRLDTHHSKSDVVSADIMLEFSLGNLAIDIFSCSLFVSRMMNANKSKPENQERKHRSESQGSNISTGNQEIGLLKLEEKGSSISLDVNEDNIDDETSLNMQSAFVHLTADTLRTITVMVTAIVVDVDERDIDSMNADAVSSIVVSVIILLVAAFLAKETVDQYQKIVNGAYHNVPSPQ
mmetsp:Transcript_15485/g.18364  ORF Transcript_15485/g.18364 Transcript_15485/m.18364 type:complete len:431 (-) Transcript_15485:779-2071(-)